MAFKNWVKWGLITHENSQIHKLHEKSAKKYIKKVIVPQEILRDTYSIRRKSNISINMIDQCDETNVKWKYTPPFLLDQEKS